MTLIFTNFFSILNFVEKVCTRSLSIVFNCNVFCYLLSLKDISYFKYSNVKNIRHVKAIEKLSHGKYEKKIKKIEVSTVYLKYSDCKVSKYSLTQCRNYG